MTRIADVRARAKTFPVRRDKPMPILGAHGKRQQLARLTFGRFKIPLSADELAALGRRADEHLHSAGTLFGFVHALLGGGRV